MRAALEPDGHARDGRECGQVDRQRRPGAPELHERDRREAGLSRPPVEMSGPDRRPRHEGGKRDQHAGRAAAHGVERAGRAAAAHLHSDAEQESPEHHGNANRRHQPLHGLAEQGSSSKHREEQRHRHGEHQHLRPQPRPAPVRDEDPPGGREPEGRMVEHEPHQRAQHIEGRLLRIDDGAHQRCASDHGEAGAPGGACVWSGCTGRRLDGLAVEIGANGRAEAGHVGRSIREDSRRERRVGPGGALVDEIVFPQQNVNCSYYT